MKLLEPIFIIGRRIDDIKGYYFTLLDSEESARITPILEELMIKRASEKSSKASKPTRRKHSVPSEKESSAAGRLDCSQSSLSIEVTLNRRISRRRWASRGKTNPNK